jgi:hypothetical protein
MLIARAYRELQDTENVPPKLQGTPVTHTQNYWVFGLCPSSGRLETQRFGNWISLLRQVRGGDTDSLGPLRES